jgi:DNA-binding MarR family transcriptional regulator
MTGPSLDEDVRRVQLAFPQVWFACHDRHVRRRDAAGDLTDRDAIYLGHLQWQEGLRPRELARHLGLAPSSLSAFLARVEGAGYVERRTTDGDRRGVELSLTDAGRRALVDASVLDAGRLAAVLERLPADERCRAVDGLALLAEACLEARLEHVRSDDASTSPNEGPLA